MKIYYHYFENKKYNGWYRLAYKNFLGHKVVKIKFLRLFTIYQLNELNHDKTRNNYQW